MPARPPGDTVRMRNLNFRVPLLAALLLGAVAAHAAPSSTALRGLVIEGPEGVLLFQACAGRAASARLLRLEDRTPEAALSVGMQDVRQIMLEPGRPLYVEFVGAVAGRTAIARQFRRALGTVESCATSPQDIAPGTLLWAAGNEPVWMLVADGAGARLQRPGSPPVRFPAAPFRNPVAADGGQVIDAWSSLDGGTVRVEISEQMCSDGRSESAFGARVSLRYGSQTFEGCAARF